MLTQEINQTLEDFSEPYRFHVVTLESGIPLTRTFDPVSLAKWVPGKNTEVVGVFENPESGRVLQQSLETKRAIFVE